MKYNEQEYDVNPEDVQAAQAADPNLNTDAAIGGLLNQQNQPQGEMGILSSVTGPDSVVTTSDAAQGQVDQAGESLTEAERFWGSGTQTTGISEEEARKQWKGGDATGWTKLPDGTWAAPGSLSGSSDASGNVSYSATASSGISAQQQQILDEQRKLNEEAYNAAVKQTQEQARRDTELTQEAQRQTTGAARSQLARMGALNVTSAGNQYMIDLGTKQQRELNSIQAQANAAIERARLAKKEGDLKILAQEMDAIDKAKDRAQASQQAYFENLKTMRELAKYEKEDASSTVSDIVDAGYEEADVPEGYFDALDKQHGLKGGTTQLMFQAAKKEKNREAIKDAREASKFDLEQMTSLTGILNSVPAGTPVNIGGSLYYGTKGTGGIEIDPQGNGTMLQVDQADGSIKVRSLGFVGAQKGDWQVVFDGSGAPYRFSPTTGQMYYMGDASTDPSAAGIDMQGVIPDGTPFNAAGGFEGFNGQCGEFTRFLAGVRVGNTLEEKIALTKQAGNASIGTSSNPARIGDVVVQSTGGWTGHVAVITGIVGTGPNTKFILSEANMVPPGGGKITSTRQISATDPTVQGFIRGNLRPEFRQGTDRAFVPKADKVTGTEKEIGGKWWTISNGKATPIVGPDGKQLTVTSDTASEKLLSEPIPPEKLAAFGIPANRVGITYGQAKNEGLLVSSGSDASIKLLAEPIPPEKLKEFGIPADKVGITYGQAKTQGLLTETTIDSEAKDQRVKEFAARYATATTEAERKSVADQAKDAGIGQSELMASASEVGINKGRLVTSATGLPADLDPATTKALNTVQLIGNDLARRAKELLTENPNLKTGTFNNIVISKLPKEFRSNIQDQLTNIAGQMQSQYFFLVSGAQVSPQEEKRLAQSVPNADATVAQNLQRIKDFKTTMYDIAGRELRARGLEYSGETIDVKSKKDGKFYHLPVSEFNSLDYEVL